MTVLLRQKASMSNPSSRFQLFGAYCKSPWFGFSQRVQIPTEYKHRPKSKDMGTTSRPKYTTHTHICIYIYMYIDMPYIYMDPLGLDLDSTPHHKGSPKLRGGLLGSTRSACQGGDAIGLRSDGSSAEFCRKLCVRVLKDLGLHFGVLI